MSDYQCKNCQVPLLPQKYYQCSSPCYYLFPFLRGSWCPVFFPVYLLFMHRNIQNISLYYAALFPCRCLKLLRWELGSRCFCFRWHQFPFLSLSFERLSGGCRPHASVCWCSDLGNDRPPQARVVQRNHFISQWCQVNWCSEGGTVRHLRCSHYLYTAHIPQVIRSSWSIMMSVQATCLWL